MNIIKTMNNLFVKISRENNLSMEVIYWNGERVKFGKSKPEYTLHLKNKKILLRLMMDVSKGAGESYSEGLFDIEGNMEKFFSLGYRRSIQVENIAAKFLKMIFSGAGKIIDVFQTNSITGSKKNIHSHYDLGNDFYELWLDKYWQYTCAHFLKKDETLEQAQINKMELVGRKLELREGDNVIELGSGWGGLAIYLAKNFKVNIKSFNISKEQVKFAREWARKEKVDHLIDFIEDDYRNSIKYVEKNSIDKVVSVGMMEHVGKKYYSELGDTVDYLLKEEGLGFFHYIGKTYPEKPNKWLTTYIFPGGYSPTLKEIHHIFEKNWFVIHDIENIRQHYWKTLHHWHNRFEQNIEKIREMFAEEFIRTWKFYLLGSASSFHYGNTTLYQIVFSKKNKHDLPLSRACLYEKNYDPDKIERWD